MNERIKELWEEAAIASAAYPSGQDNSWETQVNFMEKFAELIVRSAMDYASRNWEHGHLLAEDLRVYFGVK